MASARDFDAMEMAIDLIRKEECERLFSVMYEENVRARADTEQSPEYLRGLEFAENVLDERIGHLRDRWG